MRIRESVSEFKRHGSGTLVPLVGTVDFIH